MMKRMVGRPRISHEAATLPETVMATDRAEPRNDLSSIALSNEAEISEKQGVQGLLPAGTQPVRLGTEVAEASSRLAVVYLCGAVFLVAACTTFMLSYFRGRRLVGTIASQAAQVASSRSAGLEMRAELQADRILLSWNRDSPVLQSATGGVLKIDDGPRHREIPLDRREIAVGLVSYKPNSSYVIFRLELHKREGTRVESLEFADAPASTASVKSKPEPNTPKPRKASSAGIVPHQNGSRKIDIAKAGSEPVRRTSPKFSEAAQPARHSPDRAIGAGPGQSVPAIPIDNIRVAPSSLLSHQILPKPPPEPPAQMIKRATARPDTAAHEPASRAVARSTAKAAAAQPTQYLGYVPARPIKWAAPDAKSLGVSGISAPTDIAIKLRIDDSGRVVAAHALLDGSTHDESVTAAVTARVRQWVFEPAKMQGKNVPSDDTVVIHLDPSR
jgi:hypothetical protein